MIYLSWYCEGKFWGYKTHWKLCLMPGTSLFTGEWNWNWRVYRCKLWRDIACNWWAWYRIYCQGCFSWNRGQKNPSETGKSVNGEHKAEENSNDLIWADPKKCCYALYAKLNPDKVLLQQSPLALAKALKVVSLVCS